MLHLNPVQHAMHIVRTVSFMSAQVRFRPVSMRGLSEPGQLPKTAVWAQEAHWTADQHANQSVRARLPFSTASMERHETADEEEEEVDYDYDAQEADFTGADDAGTVIGAGFGMYCIHRNSC